MIVLIKKYREELGFTQAELANTVGVTRQTLSFIEKGRYYPPLNIAFKLKNALKQETLEDLFIPEEGEFE